MRALKKWIRTLARTHYDPLVGNVLGSW